MDLDFSDEFDVFDWAESVRYVRVEPDGTTTTYGGVQAVGWGVNDTLIDPSVQMTPRRGGWRLRASTIPAGLRPGRGDRIISTSPQMAGTWVIFHAQYNLDGTMIVCPDCQLLDNVPSVC